MIIARALTGMTGCMKCSPRLISAARRWQFSAQAIKRDMTSTTVMLLVSSTTTSKQLAAKCMDSPPRTGTHSPALRLSVMVNLLERCLIRETKKTCLRTAQKHGLRSSGRKASCRLRVDLDLLTRVKIAFTLLPWAVRPRKRLTSLAPQQGLILLTFRTTVRLMEILPIVGQSWLVPPHTTLERMTIGLTLTGMTGCMKYSRPLILVARMLLFSALVTRTVMTSTIVMPLANSMIISRRLAATCLASPHRMATHLLPPKLSVTASLLARCLIRGIRLTYLRIGRQIGSLNSRLRVSLWTRVIIKLLRRRMMMHLDLRLKHLPLLRLKILLISLILQTHLETRTP